MPVFELVHTHIAFPRRVRPPFFLNLAAFVDLLHPLSPFAFTRAKVEKADRVLYVTDAGQSSHFDQVFQVVRKAGFVPNDVELK